MKKNLYRLFLALIAVAGLLPFPVSAELGLQQIASGPQGVSAVGPAVLVAAQAVYTNNTDSAVIQQQLIAILDEAAATGNEQVVRYAIVAVMMAGGVDNLDVSKTAIDNSNVFSQYASLTAVTVSKVKSLMAAAGETAETGRGGEAGGGGGADSGGGKDSSRNSGGGMTSDPDNPFTWGSLKGGRDNDMPPTPI